MTVILVWSLPILALIYVLWWVNPLIPNLIGLDLWLACWLDFHVLEGNSTMFKLFDELCLFDPGCDKDFKRSYVALS